MFLHLQPYKQTSLKNEGSQKLVPNFIFQHIGPVVYRLDLPTNSKIHPVFHVSYLKKVVEPNCQVHTNLPEFDEEGSIWL